MFCKQCGSELKEDAMFCTNCGVKIDVEPISSKASDMDNDRTIFMFDEAQPYDYGYQQQESYNPPTQPNYSSFDQSQHQQSTQYTQQSSYVVNNGQVHHGKVTFSEAIKLFFKNYTNFSGRASKSEYWWVFLFNILIGIATYIFTMLIPPLGVLLLLYSLASLIPGISLGVRRLHDIGKTGPYLFLAFIPFCGAIILIIYMLKDSVGDNQWGPGPATRYTI